MVVSQLLLNMTNQAQKFSEKDFVLTIWENRALPVPLLNVPGGHGSSAGVPAGQKEPIGHLIPFTPSSGAGTVEPNTHRYPAKQSPVHDGEEPENNNKMGGESHQNS